MEQMKRMWKEKKVGINFTHHVSGTTQVLHRKAQEGDAARAWIQNPAGPHSCPPAHGHVDELCDLSGALEVFREPPPQDSIRMKEIHIR